VKLHDVDRTALAALLPYEMRTGGGAGSEATIGGLSFLYSPGPEWTRACKYLLTNLKHLMTYRVMYLNLRGVSGPLASDAGSAYATEESVLHGDKSAAASVAKNATTATASSPEQP
jgi:hypothetical protein